MVITKTSAVYIFIVTSLPCRVVEQELEKLGSDDLMDAAKSVLADVINLVTSGTVVFAMALTVESVVKTFSAIILVSGQRRQFNS